MANRLSKEQASTIGNALANPKKPKNKYRRADTSPGLFADMGTVDDDFDHFHDPMIKSPSAGPNGKG